jgi:hypothetical protein
MSLSDTLLLYWFAGKGQKSSGYAIPEEYHNSQKSTELKNVCLDCFNRSFAADISTAMFTQFDIGHASPRMRVDEMLILL